MINSPENDQHPVNGDKQQYYPNRADPESSSSLTENEDEVDDKVLHEDDEDFETEDKIDDAELDQGNEMNTSGDEDDLVESDDDMDAADDFKD